MATLYDQPPRQESLAGYMHWICAQARKFGFDPDAMTAADWHALCDIVRTALAIQSADALDEQLGGFGDLIGNIGNSLSGIDDSFRDFNGSGAADQLAAASAGGKRAAVRIAVVCGMCARQNRRRELETDVSGSHTFRTVRGCRGCKCLRRLLFCFYLARRTLNP
jgi:hypothetical protein